MGRIMYKTSGRLVLNGSINNSSWSTLHKNVDTTQRPKPDTHTHDHDDWFQIQVHVYDLSYKVHEPVKHLYPKFNLIDMEINIIMVFNKQWVWIMNICKINFCSQVGFFNENWMLTLFQRF